MEKEMQVYSVSVFGPTATFRILAESEQDARNWAVYMFENDNLAPSVLSGRTLTKHEYEAPPKFRDKEDW